MGLKSFWDFLEMNFLVGNVVIVRINDLKKSWFLCRLRLSIVNVFFFVVVVVMKCFYDLIFLLVY